MMLFRVETENTAVGMRCVDHATPSNLQTLALTSLTSGGRSVGIVLSRAQAMECFFLLGFPLKS
jgi:hypothetical protein